MQRTVLFNCPVVSKSWTINQGRVPKNGCLKTVVLEKTLEPLPPTFSSVQSLSHVRLFATPWTAARQASLSITNSQSPPTPMSVELVMPSNHSILCHPLLPLPSVFPQHQGLFQWVSSSHEVVKVLEFQLQHQSFQRTQDWSPLGWTGWISLQSKGLSRVFSNSKCQKRQGSETHSIPLCTWGIYLFFLEPVSTFYTSCIFPPWPQVFHKLSVRHFHFCKNSVLLLSFQHSETLHVIMDSCWE